MGGIYFNVPHYLLEEEEHMKSFYPKEEDRDNKWYIVDLKGKTLGRAATQISTILRGKNKATYTPSVDMGDNIIAINASQIKLTGNKLKNKIYYRHTGFMGGVKQATAEKQLEKNPTQIVKDAVWGMLPTGPMGYKQLKKLKVYADDNHPHFAQKPTNLDI